MRIAAGLALFLVGCESTSIDQRPYEKVTEEAYVAAVAAGESPERCRDTIGEEPALSLVRYCRSISSATRPPCNTANSCETIVTHIDGMCRGFPPTKKYLLPCIDGVPPPDWDRVMAIPVQ